MRLLLIRHGLAQSGERHRYLGRTDAPLTAEGCSLLRRADAEPELVFCSPMRRAVQTAEILFPDAERRLIPDLREMDFGVFEGRGWWEMEEDPAYRAWTDSGCTLRCPGGESREEFSARICAAFDALMRQAFGEKRELIAIVAHGGTQMAALERWGEPEREFYLWQTPCGEGWLLQVPSWPGKLLEAEKRSFTR